MRALRAKLSKDFFKEFDARDPKIKIQLRNLTDEVTEMDCLIQQYKDLPLIRKHFSKDKELLISYLTLWQVLLKGNYLDYIREEQGKRISPPYYHRVFKGWVAYYFVDKNPMSCSGLFLVPKGHKFGSSLIEVLNTAREKFFKNG